MTWKILLICFTGFLLLVFFLAYAGIIPTNYKVIPFYDEIGHFTLYGIWAFLAAKVFRKPLARVGTFVLPAGLLAISSIAVIEELLQIFSSIRTFSLADLAWGLAGICLSLFLHNIVPPPQSTK